MKMIELPVDMEGLGKTEQVKLNPEAVDLIIPHRSGDDVCRVVVGDDEYTVHRSMEVVCTLVEEGMNS